MNISSAQNAFQSIVDSLPNSERSQFLSWVNEAYFLDESQVYCKLRAIAEHLKALLPTEGTHPSEKISYSSFKNHEDEVIFHVDSFLYEEDDIVELENDGHISRNYCSQCKSTKFIKPTTFVSHSMSIPRLKFIFQNLLPDLSGKTIVDIGSRLGAILYGAYHYSTADHVIGIEVNEELCRLQNCIIEEYCMKDKIQIIHDNVLNVLPVLKTANVVILNNVFQCFMSKKEEIEIWKQLMQTINKGTLLVTVPSIEDSFRYLELSMNCNDWVKHIPQENLESDDDEFLSKIFLYEVV